MSGAVDVCDCPPIPDKQVIQYQAEASMLRNALQWRHTCASCGGKGGYYVDDGSGDVASEACDCWLNADNVLDNY